MWNDIIFYRFVLHIHYTHIVVVNIHLHIFICVWYNVLCSTNIIPIFFVNILLCVLWENYEVEFTHGIFMEIGESCVLYLVQQIIDLIKTVFPFDCMHVVTLLLMTRNKKKKKFCCYSERFFLYNFSLHRSKRKYLWIFSIFFIQYYETFVKFVTQLCEI